MFSLHRQGGQLQSDNPTLRAGFQCGDVLGGKGQAHGLSQKGRGFVLRETQVVHAYLCHLASGSQARKGKRWIGAAGDDDVHSPRWWRQMVEQKGEYLVNGSRFD